MRSLVAVLLGGLSVFLLDCGTGSPGVGSTPTSSSVPAFDACGGDIVGTWVYVESVDGDAVTDCPGSTFTGTNSFSSIYTFDADGTYSLTYMRAVLGTQFLPTQCVSYASTCSQLDTDATSPGRTVKMTCTGTPSQDCTCEISLTENGTQTGTYTTAGGLLTVTPTGSGAPDTPTGYCMSGSQLEIQLDPLASAGSRAVAAYNLYQRQ